MKEFREEWSLYGNFNNCSLQQWSEEKKNIL